MHSFYVSGWLLKSTQKNVTDCTTSNCLKETPQKNTHIQVLCSHPFCSCCHCPCPCPCGFCSSCSSSCCCCGLGVAPSQDASHHQDYYIFNRKSQPKPSFTTVTVRGPHPSCGFLILAPSSFVFFLPQGLSPWSWQRHENRSMNETCRENGSNWALG